MSATERIGTRTIDPSTLGERPGDAELVLQARSLLNLIAGHERLPLDRTPDEETRDAIRRFQESEELPPTGELNRATFEALEREAARMVERRTHHEGREAEGRGCVGAGLPGGVDADAGVGLDAAGRATGAVYLTPAERASLDLALEDLAAAGDAFARDVLENIPARAQYQRLIRAAADETLRDVESGALTVEEGAARAYEARNAIRVATRAGSTPLGRAWAEAAGRSHGTFGEFVNARAVRDFGRPMAELAQGERNAVWASVIESAGGARDAANETVRNWGTAGSVLLVASIALSAYDVVTAEDMTTALGEEVAGWLGGMLGWSAGSYGGALLCGEAAPICVGLVAVAGAVAGDTGARALYGEAIEAVAPAESP
jgi:hypothetical protein